MYEKYLLKLEEAGKIRNLKQLYHQNGNSYWDSL